MSGAPFFTPDGCSEDEAFRFLVKGFDETRDRMLATKGTILQVLRAHPVLAKRKYACPIDSIVTSGTSWLTAYPVCLVALIGCPLEDVREIYEMFPRAMSKPIKKKDNTFLLHYACAKTDFLAEGVLDFIVEKCPEAASEVSSSYSAQGLHIQVLSSAYSAQGLPIQVLLRTVGRGRIPTQMVRLLLPSEDILERHSQPSDLVSCALARYGKNELSLDGLKLLADRSAKANAVGDSFSLEGLSILSEPIVGALKKFLMSVKVLEVPCRRRSNKEGCKLALDIVAENLSLKKLSLSIGNIEGKECLELISALQSLIEKNPSIETVELSVIDLSTTDKCLNDILSTIGKMEQLETLTFVPILRDGQEVDATETLVLLLSYGNLKRLDVGFGTDELMFDAEAVCKALDTNTSLVHCTMEPMLQTILEERILYRVRLNGLGRHVFKATTQLTCGMMIDSLVQAQNSSDQRFVTSTILDFLLDSVTVWSG